MTDLVIGIDAGTSVIKAVAFALDGTQLGVHAIRNRYHRLPGGGVEQNMDETWADTAAALRGLADAVPDLARRAVAVAVTAQGDGTWLVDSDGRPVGDAWLWLDARAGELVAQIRADEERSGAIYGHTFTGLNTCQSGAQLALMRREHPERIASAAHTLHCKDWLYFRLTGTIATDPSEAVDTFGDVRSRSYAEPVLDALGLAAERRLLPPIVDGARETGLLTASAAGETGLPAGLPVVLGYVDMVCTALGGGLMGPSGRTGCSVIGSTAVHMRLAQSPDELVQSPDRTGYALALPSPGAYGQMQSSMAATINLDWIAGIAADVLKSVGSSHDKAEVVRGFDALVEGAAPAQILYHPYISEAGERGPFIDARARASLVGLSDRHGYADLVRATFEGLALAGRDCFSAMGAMPAEVRLTGGAGRSRMLRRILAATLGAPIRVSAREETGAAGAAMIAMVGLGHYPSLQACADAWVEPTLGEPTAPDAALAGLYERAFAVYGQARRQLQPVWAALPGIAGDGGGSR